MSPSGRIKSKYRGADLRAGKWPGPPYPLRVNYFVQLQIYALLHNAIGTTPMTSDSALTTLNFLRQYVKRYRQLSVGCSHRQPRLWVSVAGSAENQRGWQYSELESSAHNTS
jgi:hypothetical protein